MATKRFLAISLVLAGTRLLGQVSPNGGELQVNTYTTSHQWWPGVASDSRGNFVVVWSSLGSSGTDADAWSIHAQRFAASGALLGGELQVNTYTTNIQGSPAVAADPQGNFVVVWEGYGSSGTDTDGSSIHAQRYSANGAPLGGEFQVNTYTTGLQHLPGVAADSQGNFVVAWMSFGSSGSDTSSYSIQAQRYAANGAPVGVEFQVNTYTTSAQGYPAVAADSQGSFVVAWESVGSSGSDTSADSIQAQRYDANGTPLGGEFQVNTYTTLGQSYPAVASDSQGNFVVAWGSDGSSGTDTSSNSIQAQRYDAGGAPLGVELQVNTYTTLSQARPGVAADSRGNFVVAWHSDGSNGTDTSSFSIHGRRYDAGGTPLGGEFQVNTYTTDRQRHPVVASDALGDFVVAWHGYGSSGSDTSLYSIHAQRYDGLFRDGFETGDSSRWSSTNP